MAAVAANLELWKLERSGSAPVSLVVCVSSIILLAGIPLAPHFAQPLPLYRRASSSDQISRLYTRPSVVHRLPGHFGAATIHLTSQPSTGLGPPRRHRRHRRRSRRSRRGRRRRPRRWCRRRLQMQTTTSLADLAVDSAGLGERKRQRKVARQLAREAPGVK